VPDVLPFARRLYSGEAPCVWGTGSVGGHLHIVLDDGNTRDCHVDACLEQARLDNCQTCISLAALLRAMTRTQRAKLAVMI
jgi:hypothetical protein